MNPSIFHVLYTEDATLKIKTFDSHQARATWLAEFLLEAQNYEDDHVEVVFEGVITHVDKSIEQ